MINGAVSSVQQHFQVGPLELGLSVSGALLGAAVGGRELEAMTDSMRQREPVSEVLQRVR